ncbi:LysR family transcriptional regulator [Gluconacetobacter johannae DSM 13595]|uniref:LysR family transcriptional regulator n=1 Tax=Gluconacetobacter johannae TaxID=112140 RepID=A0A7W4J9Q7_9PROT|nr:LysR substrate-binding domain-containing protein [Gluconacetobacter johannae]MBB2177201.1 LysR family transcriptional regulator [Gluconacetobacter johannae]GBQ82095.1 LysR family transcriptional regulator [Gluconacetobacter johannae DSM 13595]
MFLRQLSYLVALDRFRHFSRAAEHCGVSQPALSAAIRQLEHELGVTVVLRNRRVFGFTAEGERVLAWAKQSIAALDGLRQEAQFAHEVAGGSLSIGTMPPAIQIVPLLMESLRAAVPALHLSVNVAASADILRDLGDQRIQMGLMYLDQVPADGPFETRHLYAEQLVLAASSQVSLPNRTACRWDEAARLPLCLLGRSMRSRQIVDACFREAGCEPAVYLETNSLELLHAELQAGRLATILPTAALPAGRETVAPLQIRRLSPCPTPGVGLVRLRQPVVTALMARSWEVACGLVLDDALKL